MATPKLLTEHHCKLFDFLVAYKSQHDGNSPSVREIAAALGYRSVSSVYYALRRLVFYGLITLPEHAGAARQICITGGAWRYWPERREEGADNGHA